MLKVTDAKKDRLSGLKAAGYRYEICAHIFKQLRNKNRHPSPTLSKYLFSLTGKEDISALNVNDWNRAMSRLGELNRIRASPSARINEDDMANFFEVFGEAALGRALAMKDLEDLTDEERLKLAQTIAGISGNWHGPE